MKSLKEKVKRDWYIIDAKNQILGRLAVKIANVLRGKLKKNFKPNQDVGDFVIVINAKDVKVTGKKKENKIYFRHTQYPGGLKKETFKELLERKPEEIIKRAVKGMLPKNKLTKNFMKRLKIYRDEKYPKLNENLKELK